MKDNNPFDRLVDAPSVRRQTSVATSARHTVDMLNLAWAGAQAVFEKHAKPEHAIALLPILIQAAAAERQRLQDEIAARNAAESAPPPAKRRLKAAR